MIRNEKIEFIAIAAIAALVLLATLVPAGVGAPVTLFEDDFEGGNLNNWTIGGTNDVTVINSGSHNPTWGGYYVQFAGSTDNDADSITVKGVINTSCYYNVNLSFARRTAGITSGEYFRVQCRSAGTGAWQDLKTYTGTLGWSTVTLDVPAIPDLQIRFLLDASADSGDFAFLDNVTVTAEPVICPGNVELDLFILVDASGSMNNSEYNLQKQGFVNAISSLVPTDGSVAICVIQFAEYVSLDIPLTRITDTNVKNNITSAITNLTRTGIGQYTNTSGAIDMATNYITSCCLDRAGKQVIDISTDGEPNRPSPVPGGGNIYNYTIARMLNAIDNGFEEVNTIGVGLVQNSTQEVFLRNLAYPQPYNDTAGFYIYAPTFAAFEAAIERKITYELQSSLGDFVWHDLNYNGIQDPDEPGIAGVTVSLHNSSTHTVVNTTTTNNAGYYSFPNLTSGGYYLVFERPAEYTGWTLQNQGTDDTKDSDVNPSTNKTASFTLGRYENNLTLDAGLYQYASIGNYVWDDQNANGIQDGTGIGLGYVNVTLYKNESGPVYKGYNITNSSGYYLFEDLMPGEYYVKFNQSTAPAGYYFSPKDVGTNDSRDSDADPSTGETDWFTLISGEHNDTIDAGLHRGVGIGDFVWHDLNANGIQDEGEPGINVRVEVNLWNETGELLINTTNTTDGQYGFGNLTPTAKYIIEFVLPDGYAFSPKDAKDDDSLDSDADETTGRTAVITAPTSAGGVNNTIDAGLYKNASLGNYVWQDLNANGIQDPGPTGIGSGVTVELYNSTKVKVTGKDTNATNGASVGNYRFTDLKPGGYYVKFGKPSEAWEFSPQDNDPDDAIDSDANATGWTGLINLTSGEYNATIDAGLYRGPAGLGKVVWNDTNANGIREDGEPMIEFPVTVKLWNAGKTSVLNTTNTTGGYYGFGGLTANTTYYIQFVLPDGYAFSPQFQGADYRYDSNANETGWAVAITPSGTGVNDTIDAGMYLIASFGQVGNFVWYDCNMTGTYYDGIQNETDIGVPGVIVHLYLTEGGYVRTTETDNDGYYRFTGLILQESYYLVFELPEYYGWTLHNQGSDDAKDSDVDPATGETAPFKITSTDIDPTWDAGLFYTEGSCQPIPELDTTVLFAVGLLTLAGYLVVRRRR